MKERIPPEDGPGGTGPEAPSPAPGEIVAERRPGGRDEGQRRFDVAFALVTLVVLAALGFFLFVKLRGQEAPRAQDGTVPPVASAADPRAEVEAAYLAYWDALAEAQLKLDPAPLERVATGHELETGRPQVLRARGLNQPHRVRAEHDYQLVVYEGGDTASVDDVLVLHMQRLDPQSLDPVEPDPQVGVHASYVLRKLGEVWRVESGVTFGYERPFAGNTNVSQAALHRGKAPPELLLAEVEQAFLDSQRALSEALLELDPAPLERAFAGKTLEGIAERVQKRRGPARLRSEHNYRIAVDGDESAWVYDTEMRREVSLDPASLQPNGREEVEVVRTIYPLKKQEGRWKIY